jgi:hypothetical protein
MIPIWKFVDREIYQSLKNEESAQANSNMFIMSGNDFSAQRVISVCRHNSWAVQNG